MSDAQHDTDRRRAILDAALACFLQFGFAKTSLDDIARRAGLSRPLLYRKYKNKEDIFGAVYDDVFASRYAPAEQAIAGRGSKRDKLLKLCEIVVVEPWALIMQTPMASEFYEACKHVIPEIAAKHERRQSELIREVIGAGKEVTEVFMLAVEGLMIDLPSAAVLRKRLAVLADHFVR